MNLSPTDALKAFLDSRVKARVYRSASETIRNLARRDEERASDDRLRALIQEGIEFGSAGDWSNRRVEFLAESSVPPPEHRSA